MRKPVLMVLSLALVATGAGMIFHYLSTVGGAERASRAAVERFEASLPSPDGPSGASPSPGAEGPTAMPPTLPAAENTAPAIAADARAPAQAVIDVPPPKPLPVAVAPAAASDPQREDMRGRWLASSADVDRSDWSPKREAAWASLLANPPAEPIALLDIPAVDLKVPVYDGATDDNMDLGAGRIRGTTRVGEVGNIGLSSHRDGFFRNLQHISEGDEVMLQDTSGQVKRYRVDAISIVTPQDVHVLYPDDRERLTLVTCYPFYFVGHAPQRFIVHAVADEMSLAENS